MIAKLGLMRVMCLAVLSLPIREHRTGSLIVAGLLIGGGVFLAFWHDAEDDACTEPFDTLDSVKGESHDARL
jgi:hypothetical protein